MSPEETELLQINQQLLDSIAPGDWKAYTQFCDPSISAFEPEARGELVEGLPFHQFYFGCMGWTELQYKIQLLKNFWRFL